MQICIVDITELYFFKSKPIHDVSDHLNLRYTVHLYGIPMKIESQILTNMQTRKYNDFYFLFTYWMYIAKRFHYYGDNIIADEGLQIVGFMTFALRRKCFLSYYMARVSFSLFRPKDNQFSTPCTTWQGT